MKQYLSRSHITWQTLSALLLLGASILMNSANALTADTQQAIELEADKATYQAKTGLIKYQGHVRVKQGSFELNADSLSTQLAKDQSVTAIIATGSPAWFQQQLDNQSKPSRGQGQIIEYQSQTGIVILRKNALLWHNGTTFTGEVIRYNMQRGDVEASGSPQTRIKLIIPPKVAPSKRASP